MHILCHTGKVQPNDLTIYQAPQVIMSFLPNQEITECAISTPVMEIIFKKEIFF